MTIEARFRIATHTRLVWLMQVLRGDLVQIRPFFMCILIATLQLPQANAQSQADGHAQEYCSLVAATVKDSCLEATPAGTANNAVGEAFSNSAALCAEHRHQIICTVLIPPREFTLQAYVEHFRRNRYPTVTVECTLERNGWLGVIDGAFTFKVGESYSFAVC